MSIESSCVSRYLDRCLFIANGYTWDLRTRQPLQVYKEGYLPEYHAHATRFLPFGGLLQGIVLQITEPAHLFDGFWVLAATRTRVPAVRRLNLVTDLRTELVEFGGWIMESEPPEDPFTPLFPQDYIPWCDEGRCAAITRGCCVVAESKLAADTWLQTRKRS